MQKILDFIYISFFGKHTLNGFAPKSTKTAKPNYIFDSVFPNEDIMKKVLPNSEYK